jgi:hypothetical protein
VNWLRVIRMLRMSADKRAEVLSHDTVAVVLGLIADALEFGLSDSLDAIQPVVQPDFPVTEPVEIPFV